MTVESAADRAVFVSSDDFGTSATFTPAGGSASTVEGIYENGYIQTFDASGAVTGTAQTNPSFQCRTADVPGVAYGDALVVNAVNYLIRDDEPDGTGMTLLVLEKQ